MGRSFGGPQASGAHRVRFKPVQGRFGLDDLAGGEGMAVGELSDEALITALRAHPELRKRISSIVLAVEGDEGELKEADAAEERMVEETRHLGREALRSWAERRVGATEREVRERPQMHRQGEKNSAGTRNSAK